jgi:UDP-N-acetylmuramate dehydrogenase
MHALTEFADITKPNEPLAPFTTLKLGGPAEWLVQPRSRAELAAVVQRCIATGTPFHVLGGGCNILVRDEGIRGVIVRLSAPAFTEVEVKERVVRAGGGASLSAVISQAARHDLTGLETLVGIGGTVGGALRTNAGDRSGEISQYVRRIEVLDDRGQGQIREREELRFADRANPLDDPIIVAAEFQLDVGQADAILKRMRKAWIQRKANQPLSFQAAGRIFKNPKGLGAAALIEQAGLAKTRVGGVEVSERNANYFVVHPGGSARVVLRLIDLVRTKVEERFNANLELELVVW